MNLQGALHYMHSGELRAGKGPLASPTPVPSALTPSSRMAPWNVLLWRRWHLLQKGEKLPLYCCTVLVQYGRRKWRAAFRPSGEIVGPHPPEPTELAAVEGEGQSRSLSVHAG